MAGTNSKTQLRIILPWDCQEGGPAGRRRMQATPSPPRPIAIQRGFAFRMDRGSFGLRYARTEPAAEGWPKPGGGGGTREASAFGSVEGSFRTEWPAGLVVAGGKSGPTAAATIQVVRECFGEHSRGGRSGSPSHPPHHRLSWGRVPLSPCVNRSQPQFSKRTENPFFNSFFPVPLRY